MKYPLRWAAGVVAVALAIVALAWPREPRITAVSTQRPMAATGTFQYIQLEGPLLMAWDTRTGEAHLCMVKDTVSCR